MSLTRAGEGPPPAESGRCGAPVQRWQCVGKPGELTSRVKSGVVCWRRPAGSENGGLPFSLQLTEGAHPHYGKQAPSLRVHQFKCQSHPKTLSQKYPE